VLKIPVVTSANKAYMPGLRALANSFRRHCGDEFELWALVSGDEATVDEARSLGVQVIANPTVPARHFPIISGRPGVRLEVYFYRLLIPGLFKDRPKSIYIDSDSIILQSLRPLLDIEFDKPVAATRMKYSLRTEITGAGIPDEPGFMSSLLIFNHAAWFEGRVFDRCIGLMNNPPVEFRCGDQAVLNYAMLHNWHELPWETQAHAGQGTLQKYPRERIYTLHFLGTNPWDPIPAHLSPYPAFKMQARELWNEYRC
jgi:hypothetical protein